MTHPTALEAAREWIAINIWAPLLPPLESVLVKSLAALIERREREAVPQWQPIDTAPEGKKKYMSDPILIGWWEGSEWCERRAWWAPLFEIVGLNGKYRGAWTDGAVKSFGFEEIHEYHPTHWMPLPKPPGALEPEGEKE